MKIELNEGEHITLITRNYYKDFQVINGYVKLISEGENDKSNNEETCCVCGGPCEMDTEYEGSAICKNENCSVHKDI